MDQSLITILVLVADLYLVPSLLYFSNLIGLSDELSGVLILSIGNAAPDVFSQISTSGNLKLSISESIGSSLFADIPTLFFIFIVYSFLLITRLISTIFAIILLCSYVAYIVLSLWFELASELAAEVVASAILFHVSSSFISSTLLVWCSAIGDYITDILFAIKGYSLISVSASIAAPIFQSLVGLSLSIISSTFLQDKDITSSFISIDKSDFKMFGTLLFGFFSAITILQITCIILGKSHEEKSNNNCQINGDKAAIIDYKVDGSVANGGIQTNSVKISRQKQNMGLEKTSHSFLMQYGKVEYWEERYKTDRQAFDWFQRYDGLKALINEFIPKDKNILQVGVGTSRLQEDMYDDGYKTILSIDNSKNAIELLKKRIEDRKGLQYEVFNALELENKGDAVFDAVIDKGTLDSLLCGEGSHINVEKMLVGISKVLKRGGVFIEISYGSRPNRLAYMDGPEFGWTITERELPKPKIGDEKKEDEKQEFHYVYICKKK
ncbi:MAG: putative protein kinase domain protein [Streblomastix strix]|uniref:Methyltransferase type 11 domain-containing protein n=1 Tax=Streblomastix strix TaxID=222440 RepID=A0A5J4V3U0_9EUKA|nr:MAG: putative protein kinase domain protein [Streblomastix strix]